MQWAVIVDRIEVKEHPNADSLQLGKVGNNQVVFQKGRFSDGDTVLFIPQKSLLPDSIAEPFRRFLKGPENNRVGSVRLRGELSEGICLSREEAINLIGRIPDGDIASALGIEKYEPPIPTELAGDICRATYDWSQHDVEQWGIYRDNFEQDEVVIVTEKVHGSQMMVGLTPDGMVEVGSKGLLSRGMVLKQSETNAYWRAAVAIGAKDVLAKMQAENPGHAVQLFGEIIPVQGGYSYGRKSITAVIFDARVNGVSVAIPDCVPTVPVLYIGALKDADLDSLCRGNEQVSGDEVHIREGVVVRPLIDRRALDGRRLMLKVINPAYAKKETGEEIS